MAAALPHPVLTGKISSSANITSGASLETGVTTALLENLKLQFQAQYPRWDQARQVVIQELGPLLSNRSIVLGMPLESRVKSWQSIQEKFERKSLALTELNELNDIVGVRAVLLFRSDVIRAHELINEVFDVVDSEDTEGRLKESQFGYQSRHYQVRLPSSWLGVPSLQNLGDVSIEIQVRTLAQHVWASASHKLQYKQEKSVPAPLLRTINRVAALLETVDLEFDRVLMERTAYEKSITSEEDDVALNVDNLAALLDALLPPENKKPQSEPYGELLEDLEGLGIRTAADLKALWAKHGKKVIKDDKADAAEKAENTENTTLSSTQLERVKRGVFKGHVGLVKKALRREHGKEVVNEVIRRRKK